jgi:hypothetical protein
MRSRRARVLYLAAVLLAAGCESVLGLGADRYQDAGSALAALCGQICTVCTSDIVRFDQLWPTPMNVNSCDPSVCENYLSQALDLGNIPLAPFANCFTASSCHDVLTCIGDAHVLFGTGIPQPVGGLCFGTCTTFPPMCEPWLCAQGSTCVPGADGGAAQYCQ